jgi:hypothetical protein
MRGEAEKVTQSVPVPYAWRNSASSLRMEIDTAAALLLAGDHRS